MNRDIVELWILVALCGLEIKTRIPEENLRVLKANGYSKSFVQDCYFKGSHKISKPYLCYLSEADLLAEIHSRS